MSWFDRLKKPSAPAPEPPRPRLDVDLESRRPTIHAPSFIYGAPSLFRRGKWVMTREGVGIITDLSDSGRVIGSLIQEDGSDLRPFNEPAGQVRIARASEIPWPRRMHFDEAALLHLGYN